jgi:thiol-disulfide isomerase/thioredoxin
MGCYGKKPEKTGQEGKPMPAFNVLLMDSTTKLNMGGIPAGNPVVILLFSPYCPYCRAETEEIIDDMKSLKNIRFYFLSNFPFDPIKQYAEHYRLDKYKNITVGQDYGVYLPQHFNVAGVPYIAIYSKDKKLKEVFIGKTDINEIKNIALEQ